MIHGIDVILINKIEVGKDGFNNPIYEDKQITVKDVLVSTPQTDDIINITDLDGKKATFVLGIPKGDTNNWENSEVVIFNKKYKTYGNVIQGIEENVPLRWHKKVLIKKYE